MADEDVLSSINELATEEHELFQKEARGEANDADRDRLKDLEVRLDQCWDLLHQRRARRAAGRTRTRPRSAPSPSSRATSSSSVRSPRARCGHRPRPAASARPAAEHPSTPQPTHSSDRPPVEGRRAGDRPDDGREAEHHAERRLVAPSQVLRRAVGHEDRRPAATPRISPNVKITVHPASAISVVDHPTSKKPAPTRNAPSATIRVAGCRCVNALSGSSNTTTMSPFSESSSAVRLVREPLRRHLEREGRRRLHVHDGHAERSRRGRRGTRGRRGPIGWPRRGARPRAAPHAVGRRDERHDAVDRRGGRVGGEQDEERPRGHDAAERRPERPPEVHGQPVQREGGHPLVRTGRCRRSAPRPPAGRTRRTGRRAPSAAGSCRACAPARARASRRPSRTSRARPSSAVRSGRRAGRRCRRPRCRRRRTSRRRCRPAAPSSPRSRRYSTRNGSTNVPNRLMNVPASRTQIVRGIARTLPRSVGGGAVGPGPSPGRRRGGGSR